MRKLLLALIVMGLLLVVSLAALAQEATPEATAGTEATADATVEATASALMSGAQADILDAAGNPIGQMILVDAGNGKTVIQVQVSGLPAGWHGFHLHTTGMCDGGSNEPFSSAGGHWTLGEETHPNHTGDMPLLLAGADGTARLAFETDRFTIADLFDADGTAVMIHSGADNFANIPERYGAPDEDTLRAGDAGTRLACGVIVEAAPAQ